MKHIPKTKGSPAEFSKSFFFLTRCRYEVEICDMVQMKGEKNTINMRQTGFLSKHTVFLRVVDMEDCTDESLTSSNIILSQRV